MEACRLVVVFSVHRYDSTPRVPVDPQSSGTIQTNQQAETTQKSLHPSTEAKNKLHQELCQAKDMAALFTSHDSTTIHGAPRDHDSEWHQGV